MPDTQLSRAPAIDERVLFDARAVADVSAAETADASPAPVQAVLRTRPARHSGSASLEGVFLDAATGRFIDASGAPASLEGVRGIVRYEGSYDVLAVMSGPGNALPGRYSWTEERQVRRRGRRTDPRGAYDPFARPGEVACGYDPAAAGAPFSDVRLLPQNWYLHAPEATTAPTEPDAATARRWLTGPNHLLFARAAGVLARTGELDRALLANVRALAHGYRRAVLHYVMLISPRRLGGSAALAADLASGGEPSHRRAAALGLLAARLSGSRTTVAPVTGWPPITTRGGLLDPVLIAGDSYVREAFAMLTPR